MSAKPWDEMTPAEKQAACVEARRRGLSASQIAIELGARSRNQILGCFWRIAAAARERGEEPPVSRFAKYASRPRPAPAKAGAAHRRANPYRDPEPARIPTQLHVAERWPIAAAQVPVPPAIPRQLPPELADHTETTAVLFMKRKLGQCAWPIGDWNISIFDRKCCGARTNGRTYCPDHRIASAPRPANSSIEARP